MRAQLNVQLIFLLTKTTMLCFVAVEQRWFVPIEQWQRCFAYFMALVSFLTQNKVKKHDATPHCNARISRLNKGSTKSQPKTTKRVGRRERVMGFHCTTYQTCFFLHFFFLNIDNKKTRGEAKYFRKTRGYFDRGRIGSSRQQSSKTDNARPQPFSEEPGGTF